MGNLLLWTSNWDSPSVTFMQIFTALTAMFQIKDDLLRWVPDFKESRCQFAFCQHSYLTSLPKKKKNRIGNRISAWVVFSPPCFPVSGVAMSWSHLKWQKAKDRKEDVNIEGVSSLFLNGLFCFSPPLVQIPQSWRESNEAVALLINPK